MHVHTHTLGAGQAVPHRGRSRVRVCKRPKRETLPTLRTCHKPLSHSLDLDCQRASSQGEETEGGASGCHRVEEEEEQEQEEERQQHGQQEGAH